MSLNSDVVRNVIHVELQKSMTEVIIPSIMTQVETKLMNVQEQNRQMVNTANMVMRQVQQTFEQLRNEQMKTTGQLIEERRISAHRNSYLEKLTQVQMNTQSILEGERRQLLEHQSRLENLYVQQGIHLANLTTTNGETRHGFNVLEEVLPITKLDYLMIRDATHSGVDRMIED